MPRDLDIIESAARELGKDIRESVWVNERERTFLSNAFLAFADKLREVIRERNRQEIAAAD